MKSAKMLHTKGFTLVELMVVVVIIGILAAIAIPNYLSMQQKAKEASTKNNMHTLHITVEDFNTRSDSHYPGDLSTTILVANPSFPPGHPDAVMRVAAVMQPPYGLTSMLSDVVKNVFSSINPALQDKRCEAGDFIGVIGYEASNMQGDDPVSGAPWNEAGDGPALMYRITGMGVKAPLLVVMCSSGVF